MPKKSNQIRRILSSDNSLKKNNNPNFIDNLQSALLLSLLKSEEINKTVFDSCKKKLSNRFSQNKLVNILEKDDKNA